ncbi:MAG: tRNA preQ1(34) S-adenosylmethionine ribosyltransferase-isomerase QueA [Paludibacter sp.]|jgi:S-adenosylmethionine:tRNA ribosyltransferase-isomerase|nr:tRNA preQ1(34) S-adenosylmethionine ribosyltransferase-isomerase QueA [Paludibacter sp.]
MRLSNFKFELPDEKIAQYPTYHRDESRLMVLDRKTGAIEHKTFKDVLSYFKSGDLFVFNDTKVFPARLYGNKEKTGAQIEVFLLRELNPAMRLWDVLVEPARKIRIGNKIYFGPNDELVAEVIDNTTSRGRTLRFLFDGTHDDFKRVLFALGETPLPKNLKRKVEPEDGERYQNIYARNEGAVSVPAAGLHFSRELLKRMEIKEIEKAFITSHMSLGVFREIDVEDLTKHKMDSEQITVSDEAQNAVNQTRERGGQICAIGTTVMRTLETVVDTNGKIKAFDGWTSKFIFPPYDFTLADALITNFHLPYSTLLMLAAAFGEYDQVMNAYQIALKEDYRFGVYGDAMLII